MHLFTPNDLLQYLYNETTPAKTLAIKLALLNDSELQMQLESMESSINLLKKVSLSKPSIRSMQKLLDITDSLPPHKNP